MTEIERLLRDHIVQWQSGWSMGSFGAIAEFHQDEDEQAVVDDAGGLMRATRRGAIHLDRRRMGDVKAIAYETLSPRRHRWSQGVALCLPDAAARREARNVLTEIGPDDHAIRGIDRTGILFDMGLSLPQCDFCIRTSDPRLLPELRANLGRSLFEPGNTAMTAILAAHPHRVALTHIGRVEVYQLIGGPDTGGVSPPGPHTHVLPKLLKSGRTHSANTPVPEGMMPLAFLHPGNPVIGPMGQEHPFDPRLHADFQRILTAYGHPEAVNAKTGVQNAVLAGLSPGDVNLPAGRVGRASARIALRQLAHVHHDSKNVALLQTLASWQDVLETRDAEAEDDDAPGH